MANVPYDPNYVQTLNTSLKRRVLRFASERYVPSAHGKVRAMRNDTKETIVQLLTLAAVVLAGLLTKRDMRLP